MAGAAVVSPGLHCAVRCVSANRRSSRDPCGPNYAVYHDVYGGEEPMRNGGMPSLVGEVYPNPLVASKDAFDP